MAKTTTAPELPPVLILYLKSATLGEETLVALRCAGYMPVAVDSFDDLRVMPLSPLGAVDAAARSAFEVIATTGLTTTQQKFGEAFAAAMLKLGDR